MQGQDYLISQAPTSNNKRSKKTVIGVSLLLIATVGACLYAFTASTTATNEQIQFINQNDSVEGYIRQSFQAWSSKYEKTYGSGDEVNYRLLVFRSNYHKIKEFYESGPQDYNLALNQFADMTEEEFRAKYLTLSKQKQDFTERQLPTEGLPEEVNWVDAGIVNKVKNQGQCGSCWAFSAIAAVESLYASQNKELRTFSEQQLVDCSTEDHGCGGGFMNTAFEYIVQNGIEEDKDYPYRGTQSKCKHADSKAAFRITGHESVPQQDLDQLKAASAQRVVSVAVEVTFKFQFYHSGVFSSRGCGNKYDKLNHGVALVGYGTENGKDYWLVRNSWGVAWGSQGYIKLLRTNGTGPGTCGVAWEASYPVV